MADKLYADVDEEGKIILPQNLIEAWGISKGDRILVDHEGTSLQLRPPAADVCGHKGLSAAHECIRYSS